MKHILSLLAVFLFTVSAYCQDSTYHNPYKSPTIDALAYDMDHSGPQRIDWFEFLNTAMYIQGRNAERIIDTIRMNHGEKAAHTFQKEYTHAQVAINRWLDSLESYVRVHSGDTLRYKALAAYLREGLYAANTLNQHFKRVQQKYNFHESNIIINQKSSIETVVARSSGQQDQYTPISTRYYQFFEKLHAWHWKSWEEINR